MQKILPGREPPLKKGPYPKIIPVCEPHLAGNELKYVIDCIKSNWISSAGSYIEKFENAFKKYCACRYAISCSGGTAALHLSLAALGIGEGDEVIIPAFTMIATANAITYLGAKPVLVDAEPRTWNINTAKIAEKVTSRTKAIIPVHTYGIPAEMDELTALARKYRLKVIEDAAEAHGAVYKQRKVGSIGIAGCFSFYGNKIITTGEGGMITTNDRRLAEKIRILRDHAFSEERHFWHKYLGYNYRMTNLQAAVGLAQTERFEELIKARKRNAALYDTLLKDIPGISRAKEEKYSKGVSWMYAMLIGDEFGISRDALRKYLAARGVETRTFFIPIHLQPIYRGQYRGAFPVSERLCQRGLYLPSAASLTVREIKYITDCIKSASRLKR